MKTLMQIAWSHLPGVMHQTHIDALTIDEFDAFIAEVEDNFTISLSDEALAEVVTFGDVSVIVEDAHG